MPIAFFFLLLISSVQLWALDLKDTHLLNGCTLFDWAGEKVKVFPGSYCQFFDDGSLLTGSTQSLKYMTKDSEIKWEYKQNIHHQVNMSHDLQRILVLSSDYTKKDGARWRVDRLVVLSREGKILFSESSDKYLKQLNLSEHDKVKGELTHFNSFYEIPEIKGPVPSYIKKGNYIANSNSLGMFILSPDLKKILHYRKIPTSFEHNIHDVQILPSGRMIYFNNVHNLSPQKGYFSTIEEMDLNSNKIEFEFRSKTEATFFSRYCGGVQKIDEDTYLFSHMLTGTYVYSKKKKMIVNYLYQTHIHGFNHFYPAQQVKAVDVRAFLSHWK